MVVYPPGLSNRYGCQNLQYPDRPNLSDVSITNYKDNVIIATNHETNSHSFMNLGFASFEYEDDGYEPTHVVRLDFTVNDHLVEELSIMVHNERARALAKFVVGRLKRVIDPQPFKIKIKGQGNS